MNMLAESKTKFIFIGVHDQFVVSLDVRAEELKRKLLELLQEYESYDIGGLEYS